MRPPQQITKTLHVIFCLLGISSLGHAAVVDLSSFTNSGWTSIGANFDYTLDQQTGQPQDDINGNATNPGFLTRFSGDGTPSLTDGYLAFRVRMSTQDGNKSNYTGYLWVGIDANNNGSIDAYVACHGGNSPDVSIYGPGADTNLSPSTTSIDGTSTYSYTNAAYMAYRAVSASDGGTTTDISGNGVDYYVSFQMPFADLVTFFAGRGITGLTENSPFRYVVATSTQNNSLNQDLGGIDNSNYVATSTWESLGGLSTQISGNGVVVVPELHSSFLVIFGATVLLLRRRK